VSKWEMADIIKVSEEEVSFVTKGDDASFDVVRKSFHPKLKLLLVTEGPKGSITQRRSPEESRVLKWMQWTPQEPEMLL